MWLLLIVLMAAVVAVNPRLSQRGARLAVVPFVLAIVGFQALKSGLL